MNKKRGVWAYIYVPCFFLFIGYGLYSVVGAPIIETVYDTIQLFILNDVPHFDEDEKVLTLDLEQNEAPKIKITDNQEWIASSEVSYPNAGEQYGELSIDKLKIKEALFLGDSESELRGSIGQFNGSHFPGELGTSLIGGHNTSSLGALEQSEVGDVITIKTTYGTYTYQVTGQKVAKYTDASAFPLDGKEPKLILYTCYPVKMLGLTDNRLFVYADYVSGPLIDEQI